MDRSGFLYLLGGGVVGSGGTIVAQNGGDVGATVDDIAGLFGQDETLMQEFGSLSPGFEQIVS